MVDNHWTLANAKPIGNRRSVANNWGEFGIAGNLLFIERLAW